MEGSEFRVLKTFLCSLTVSYIITWLSHIRCTSEYVQCITDHALNIAISISVCVIICHI